MGSLKFCLCEFHKFNFKFVFPILFFLLFATTWYKLHIYLEIDLDKIFVNMMVCMYSWVDVPKTKTKNTKKSCSIPF